MLRPNAPDRRDPFTPWSPHPANLPLRAGRWGRRTPGRSRRRGQGWGPPGRDGFGRRDWRRDRD